MHRLPVIGSFVNKLFIAALLLSVAIEGIQTCFHADHLWNPNNRGETIKTTFPFILACLALINALMQYCLRLAKYKTVEQQLEKVNLKSTTTTNLRQLNVSNLEQQTTTTNTKDISFFNDTNNKSIDLRCLSSGDQLLASHLKDSTLTKSVDKFETTSSGGVTLKAIVKPQNGELIDANGSSKLIEFRESCVKDPIDVDFIACGKNYEWHELLRSYSSPIALFICFTMVWKFNDGFVTEISDASLAISVVILMFAGLYPPIKAAGRVLLQSVPQHVDIEALSAQIRRENPATVLNIHNLYVWSLANNDKVVGTCHLLVDSKLIDSNNELNKLIKQTKLVFASHNVAKVTIQIEFGCAGGHLQSHQQTDNSSINQKIYSSQTKNSNLKHLTDNYLGQCQIACCKMSDLTKKSTETDNHSHSHNHSHNCH